MKNEMQELNLDQMEQVSGGLVVEDPVNKKFWVVRQDGNVIAPAPDLESAISFAKSFDISGTVMTLEEYRKHFGRELIW